MHKMKISSQPKGLNLPSQSWGSTLTPGFSMSAEVTQASLAIQVRLVMLCRSSSVMRGLRSTSEEKTTMILAVDSTTVWMMRWMSSGEFT